MDRPGRRPIPVTKQDIERAIRHTKSNQGAARYLGISWETYRKAASRYTHEDGTTYFDAHKNKSGKGIPKLSARKTREHDLIDLLEGRASIQFTSVKRLKERLIDEGFIPECCNQCGYEKRRLMDEKIPLILSFKNGNKKDWKLDNLELLCYNCYFIYVGDLFKQAQLDALELQEITKPVEVPALDIPPQHEELIHKHMNNKPKPEDDENADDYGNDLISFVKMKRK